MPRPQKEGIDYFPLDVNFFVDKKVKILKARFGADGITIYLYLLCEIYRAGYYIHFDDDALFITSDDLNMSPDKVKQVLKFLLERSLFNNTLFQSDTILTSAGIQRRFQLAVKERAKKNPVGIKDFWLLTATETESFIKMNPIFNNSRKNEDNSGKNPDKSQEESPKKSKVKESKGNKKISPEPPCGLQVCAAYEMMLLDGSLHLVQRSEIERYQELYPAVDIDQEFRKMIGWLESHPKNRKTLEGMAKFINGWLCRAQDSSRPQPEQAGAKKNQFHNFDQRDTDYDALMLKQVREWAGEGGSHGQTGNA